LVFFVKVLHIDDSPEICDLYADMFEADNHTVQSVNDAKQGLNLVIENEYDLILLDMCMPRYSGMDFLRDLKQKRPSELKKVLVTSVLQFNENQTKVLMKYGVHAIEEKPKDLQQLERIQKDMWLR
ncbi:MAG: response regulator, partial [Nitrosopumilaceae archaeon]